MTAVRDPYPPLELWRRPLRPADATGDPPRWEPFGEARAGETWSALDFARDQVRQPVERWQGDWIIATVRPDLDAPPEGALFVVVEGEPAGEVPGSAWSRWDGAEQDSPATQSGLIVDARRGLCGAAGLWPLLEVADKIVRIVMPDGRARSDDTIRMFVATWRRRAIDVGAPWLDVAPPDLVNALLGDLRGVVPGSPALVRLVSSPRSSAELDIESTLAAYMVPAVADVVRSSAFCVSLDAMVREHVAAWREAMAAREPERSQRRHPDEDLFDEVEAFVRRAPPNTDVRALFDGGSPRLRQTLREIRSEATVTRGMHYTFLFAGGAELTLDGRGRRVRWSYCSPEVSRYGIDTAAGADLDAIAARFGVNRIGRPDAEVREELARAYIARTESNVRAMARALADEPWGNE